MQFLSPSQIVLESLIRLIPVWASLAVVLGASLLFRKKLGLYGHVVQSSHGIRRPLSGWLLAVRGDLRSGDRAFRSARPDRGNEERAARRDRTAFRAALSLRRRQAGARRVRPGHRRRPRRSHHRPARDVACALDRYRARTSGRLFRPTRRRDPVVPRQSGAGLSDHPALLPAGVAGHPRDANPLYTGWVIFRFSGRAVHGALCVGLPHPAAQACDLPRGDDHRRRVALCHLRL